MARVRVTPESLTDLFRPGGTVEPISRADTSGRSRFNLETGLQFADKLMENEALGRAANLLGRGGSALYRAANAPDMNQLRQQAAARLGQPQQAATPSALQMGKQQQFAQDMSNAAATEAVPAASAFGSTMVPGMNAPRVDYHQAAADSLAAWRNAAQPAGPEQPASQAAPQAAPMDEAIANYTGVQPGQQQPSPAPGEFDMNRPHIDEAALKRYNDLRKSLRLAIDNGATPAQLKQIQHEMQLQQDRMLPKLGASMTASPVERMSLGDKGVPPLYADRPTQDVMQDYLHTTEFAPPTQQELPPSFRSPVGARSTAVGSIMPPSPPPPEPVAERPPIWTPEYAAAQEAAAKQAAPAAAPVAAAAPPMAAPALAAQAPAAAAAPPPVTVVQTPKGDMPVVKLPGGRAVMHDPENGRYVMVARDPKTGRPVEIASVPADMVAQVGAPPAAPTQAAPTSEDARSQMAARLREPVARPELRQQEEAPDQDYLGRTPRQVAEARRRAAELVGAPTIPQGPLSQEQLLALASQARTPEQQAEILRRTADVDVWGATLGDILLGSPKARAQYLDQIHKVMPKAGKSEEELAVDRARAQQLLAQARYYGAKPELESEKARNQAEINRQRLAEAIEKNLTQARNAEHKLAETTAHHEAQTELAKMKQNLNVANFLRAADEFERKLKAGAFKHGGVNVFMGNDRAALAQLAGIAENMKRTIDSNDDQLRKDEGEAADVLVAQDDFDKRYPGVPQWDKPIKPTKPTGGVDEEGNPIPASKRELEQYNKDLEAYDRNIARWDNAALREKEIRDQALQRRYKGLRAKSMLADEEKKKAQSKAEGILQFATDALTGMISPQTKAKAKKAGTK